jgi:hypothetical protein
MDLAETSTAPDLCKASGFHLRALAPGSKPFDEGSQQNGGSIHRIGIDQPLHVVGQAPIRVSGNRFGYRTPIIEVSTIEDVDDGFSR